MGYAKGVNENTSEAVFSGREHSRRCTLRETHTSCTHSYYIHLNPLDFTYSSEWSMQARSRIRRKALAYFVGIPLGAGHLDYLGIKNFPSVIYPLQLADVFGNRAREASGKRRYHFRPLAPAWGGTTAPCIEMELHLGTRRALNGFGEGEDTLEYEGRLELIWETIPPFGGFAVSPSWRKKH